MDGVDDGDPDIEQAEAGDQAARDAVQEQRREMRQDDQQAVLIPKTQPGPGQNKNDEAEVEAHNHADKEVEALQPARRGTRGLPALRRGGNDPRRQVARRWRRKQIRLMRHAINRF
jgi:hypothetical protein